MPETKPFEDYLDVLEKSDVFTLEPNGTLGKLITPLVSQSEMLKSRLDLRFETVDFDSKTVLDIGAGTGMFSAYAAHCGAERVVALEPEVEGSSSGMIQTLEQVSNRYSEIEIERVTLQEYNAQKGIFDVIISNNSINHLDEQSCIELRESRSARKNYHEIFDKIDRITAPGGKLVISDAGNRNFWNDINLPNPFIGLEWQKHQQPEIWSIMLQEHGFNEESIKYISYMSQLGNVGKTYFSNYPLSYLTYSKFVLVMKKTVSQ